MQVNRTIGIGFCYSPKKGPQDPSTQSLDFMFPFLFDFHLV